MKLPKELRPETDTIRSMVALQIASGLVSRRDQPAQQANVLLRARGDATWRIGLLGSGTAEGIEAVASGESVMAITNPSASLSLAFRGTGPFTRRYPVRTLAVIPSLDQAMLAVRSTLGLASIEEIAEKRVPLRLSLRGQPDHFLHTMLDDLLAAIGCSLETIKGWGGDYIKDGRLPRPDGPRFQMLARGEIDAIFDESVTNWCNDAPPAGMTVLPLREETVAKLEAIGYRRAVLRQADFPNLPGDVLTLDFSGWPIFVHEDTPDDLVAQMCEALDARKELIPWQSPGPLPVERMARDAADTPQLVPLHKAAERYWRSCGYL